MAGGPFDQAATVLLETGFRLNWQSLTPERQKSKARCSARLWELWGAHGGGARTVDRGGYRDLALIEKINPGAS